MSKDKGIIRLLPSGDPDTGLSPWTPMPLVGDIVKGEPNERYSRVFDTVIEAPTEVRAGVWEATEYSENLMDYPYNEIVFLLEGSISIVDSDGVEERFEPGDCFFLKKGFSGTWDQHERIKIFHMTVDPK